LGSAIPPTKEITVTRIATLMLLFSGLLCTTAFAQLGSGHENACTVVNVNYGGGQMNVVCSSNSVYVAFLTGNSSAGNCPTSDIDTIKIFESLSIAARVSGLPVTVWYNTGCTGATRIINSIELNGRTTP